MTLFTGQVSCRLLASLFCFAGLLGCAHDPYSVTVIDARDAISATHKTATYKIRKGDTLYAIAFEHGISVAELTRINGIDEPYVIHPDEVLLVPSTRVGRAVRPPLVPIAKPEPSSGSSGAQAPRMLPASVESAVSASAQQVPVAAPTISAPAAEQVAPALSSGWLKPTSGSIGRGFSQAKVQHKGVDFEGRVGDQIVASRDGKVVYAGDGLKDYGLLLIIKHNDQYLSAYAYNRQIEVKEGDIVRQGQIIASMGKKNNKPVLHFEIREYGKPIDPLTLLGK